MLNDDVLLFSVLSNNITNGYIKYTPAFFIQLHMSINKAWHLKNKMPKNPTFEQRVKWHRAHQNNCSCRPIGGKLAEEMNKRGIKF